MAEVKTRATGWIGSQFVGIPAATGQTASSVPTTVGSQGKKPGEWIGSKYIGPAPTPGAAAPGTMLPPNFRSMTQTAAPSAPSQPTAAPAQALTPQQQYAKAREAWLANPVGPQPIFNDPNAAWNRPAGSTTPTPEARPPLTREQYDALTPAQRAAYFAGTGTNTGAPINTTTPTSGTPPSTFATGGTPRATEGFDSTKLSDPTQGTTHKYVGGRIMAAGGGVDQILADPKFAGWTKVSDDKIRSPEGSIYDTSRDVGGANVAQWNYVSGGPAGVRNDGIIGNDPHSANYTKPGGLGYKGPPVTGPSSTQPNPPKDPGTASLRNTLVQQLLDRSRQSLNPNAANSPAIRAQADPYSANVQRQTRNYLADVAESGGGTHNMRGETRLANERAGQATGLFESTLVGKEVEARRNEIQNALAQLGDRLTEEERQALQMELARLQDATQRFGVKTSADTARYGIDTSNNQFMKDLGLRAEDRFNYWDAVNKGLLG